MTAEENSQRRDWLKTLSVVNQILLFLALVATFFGFIGAFVWMGYIRSAMEEKSSGVTGIINDSTPVKTGGDKDYAVSFGKVIQFGKELPMLIEVKTQKNSAETFLDISYRQQGPFEVVNWVVKDEGKVDVTLFGGHKKIIQYVFFLPETAAQTHTNIYPLVYLKGEPPDIYALVGVIVDEDSNKDGVLNYLDDCELFYYDLLHRNYHAVLKNVKGIQLGDSVGRRLPVYIHNDKGLCEEVRILDVVEKGISSLVDKGFLDKVAKMPGVNSPKTK